MGKEIIVVCIILVIGLWGWHTYVLPMDDTIEKIDELTFDLKNNLVVPTIADDKERLKTTITEIEEKVFDFTNDERSALGRAPLKYDSELSDISRKHSEDMAENNYFSHTNQQGLAPTDRAINAGYPIRKYLSSNWYSEGIGENIFLMPYGNVQKVGYVGKYDSEKISKAVINGWMNSMGHRMNILDEDYSNLGVGVAFDGNSYYVTQNFW